MAYRLLSAAAMAACTISASQALAEDVNISLVNEASQVAGCERLAEVRGRSNWGGVFASKSYDWALGQMKERAVALGATHVLLLNATNGYTGSNMLGVAYRCPATAITETTAP